MAPPLAQAFLALADDPAEPEQRSLPRALTAAVAAVAIAVWAPLGFFVVKPSDHPVAALGSKFSLVLDDD